MRKYMAVIVGIIAVCLVVVPLNGKVAAQEKQEKQEKQEEPKKFKVSDDFLNTWKKVGDMTKEIRSFKTEKAVTVAGVRGAEAEDEALKRLYYKGGIRYPNRLELKNAIELLENFVKENEEDPTVVQSKYFIAQCHMQLGEVDVGVEAYNDLIENFPKSEYAKLAKSDLENIAKQK